MREVEFREWLKEAGLSPKTVGNYVSECGWVEKHVPEAYSLPPDLDMAFDEDECASLSDLLEYGGGDHPLAYDLENADVQSNLATYRTALNRYIGFRRGHTCSRRKAPLSASGHDESRPSHAQVDRNNKPLPEDCGPIATLWKQHCESREALSTALGRTSNILGEIAERVVAEYYGAKLLPASAASADVELEDGTLIQVKARIPKQGKTTSLSAIRSWGFDRLAVLVFNDSGSIQFAGEIDVDAVKEHAKEVPHTNSWNITTSQAFLQDPRMVVLTDEYNSVLATL